MVIAVNLILQAIKSMFRHIELQIVKLSEIRPNWNQNNSEAPDYINSRPFYSKQNSDIILDTTFTLSEAENSYKFSVGNGDAIALEGWYTVKFDGIQYNNLVARDIDGFYMIEIPDNSFYLGSWYEDSIDFRFYNVSIGTHDIKVIHHYEFVKQIDDKYLPVGTNDIQTLKNSISTVYKNVLSKLDPVGTGSFSMNRKDGTVIGHKSHSEGINCTASDAASHAEGYETTAGGRYSHSEGHNTFANGENSHSEGLGTYANGENQHAQGKYNILDYKNKYAHIVGNGISSSKESNAHTLDWDGLGWFAGGLKVGGTGQDDEAAKEVALKEDIPELPTPSVADSGNALTVQPDGSWGLSPASGAMTVVDDGEGNLTFLNVSVSTQEV